MKEKEISEFCDVLLKTKLFDKLEIKIIRSMLLLEREKRKTVTASMIAKNAKISVTNCYKYLYSLQKKGIVEHETGKNKIFWLSRTNPFKRLFSIVAKEYLERKKQFSLLESYYNSFMPENEIWRGKQVFDRYSSEDDFINKTAFLFDIARNDVMITAEDIVEDIVVLDAIKRAVDRGIRVRLLCSDMPENKIELLRKIGVEVKWIDKIIQPFVMVVDNRHGITVEMKNERSGVWFLNKNTDYKKKFDMIWENAGDV